MVDDVQLPDLEVIRRYSLAVRAAAAPRAEVVAALQADLAWLTGGAGPGRRTARAAEPASVAPREPARPRPAKRRPAAPADAAEPERPVRRAPRKAPARTARGGARSSGDQPAPGSDGA